MSKRRREGEGKQKMMRKEEAKGNSDMTNLERDFLWIPQYAVGDPAENHSGYKAPIL